MIHLSSLSTPSATNTIHDGFNVLFRILIAYIFVVAGWGKIVAYAATAQYMANKGLPSLLLPLVILLELGGGLALIIGFQTRLIAAALTVFSILTAFIFHGQADDHINFMKNFAMAGGLGFVMLYGGGRLSVDAYFARNK